MHIQGTVMSVSQMVPVSFYLKLEEGAYADLEVVSRASLELIDALRELIEFTEPNAQIKMRIQQGDQGSLNLKTFVQFFTGRSADEKKRREAILRGVITGATFFLLELTASHYGDKILDRIDAYVSEWMEAAPEASELSDAERAAMANELRDALRGAVDNKAGAKHIRKFYAEVKRDSNIEGVALVANHDEIPVTIIPREEFSDRASEPKVEELETDRNKTERMSILLIQPRLHADNKAWRFSVGGMEFAAKIEDEKFVARMLSGELPVPAVEGVYFDVDLTVTEERSGNAWVVKSRRVTRVHDVIARPHQPDLLQPLDDEDDDR